MKPNHFVIPVLALLTTWITGFWWRAGNGTTEYGLPLPWKTEQVIPTCNMCPLPMSYNLVFFLIDVAFYAAIGHLIVLLYARTVLDRKDC